VVLADDHALLRLSVAEELENAGFVVCGQATTAPGAIEIALREQPDLCLLDLTMPGGGLSAAAEIRSRLPATHVVILTASEAEVDFLAAVRAGVSGYLLKSMDPLRLPPSLWDVLSGVPAFPRRLTPALLLAARETLGRPAPSLV
jgi:two-component system NarL family response regulator